MTKSLVYAGGLAAALLVFSTGPAAAQSGDGSLGSVAENAPGSVTGSLPGYTTGPIGSTGHLACNVGSVANLAGNVAGMPIPVPIAAICIGVRPVAESADSLISGDIQGSVDAIVGGVPVVGNSIGDNVDTGSATESVEDVVGDRLGSLSESSLNAGN